ncbi:hypothetical protein [Gemmatimonas sp.]|uniref:hypothetical protein n=1 Tax=Gemmatimonas sp. TaxID=1962908 RepID=UPI0035686D27
MLTLTRCTITTDDDTLGELMPDAVVIISGDSPNSTVQISVPDNTRRKFVRVERVLEAVIKGSGKEWVIQGRSENLEQAVGVSSDESQVTYRINAAGGCQGCS